jgi:hypothetical protein
MKKILVLLLCLGLVGCATLPGSISERVSGFDKTKEIVMEPAWAGNSLSDGLIKLGLYKTSRMDPDKVILTAVVLGAHNFSAEESLQFNINGEFVSFESIDPMTNIELEPGVYNSVYSSPATNLSSKRYEVTKDFIKELIEAKDVWVRINLSQDYVEAKFSVSVPMGARTSFRKFYSKVWGANEFGGKK